MAENLETKAFDMISLAGEGLDIVYQAMEAAREADFARAQALLNEAQDSLNKAHQIQARLLFDELNGDAVKMNMLITHAQDQLQSSLMAHRFASEIIMLYEALSLREGQDRE